MRRFIRITAGGDSDQMLSDRISYLFAAPPQCDLVRVAMAGIAEPQAFELHAHARPGQHPPPARGRTEKTEAPVSLLDAPLVLTSQADPTRVAGNPEPPRKPPRHNGHHHDTLVAGPGAEQAAIVHKALQIDAFAWQALTLEDGVFSGEILVGYNELEWLVRSYQDSSTGDPGANGRRRLVELRGKLGGWIEERAIAGLAHLVEPQGISIVSDIDDTIKASNITAEKRIVLETVFARPPQAVPGMAALYRRWYELGAEFHYVSNSPWQLYPSLDGFFHQNRFPPGSAHLRAFDPNDLLSIKNYTGTPQLKRDTIEKLFATFPERKYVLVGDCGEQDLETYAELARRFPGRILRIYIRDLFAPMSVASLTTDTAAADTVRKGTIPYGVVQPQPNNGWHFMPSNST
ncbi:hypothetical protein GGF46_004432 [Coemansia sp. RSA 552]|nr:hypothetical protein GGF46_004432 [Coemansia sp. RSA 552]